MRSLSLAVGVSLLQLACAFPAPPWPNTTAVGDAKAGPADLNDLAKKAGKMYFGTAVDNPQLDDKQYTDIAFNKAVFGQVTPANGQKYMYTERSRGTYSFVEGDAVVDKATAAGQLLRCHALLWYQQLPNWLTTGNFDNATLITIVQEHITAEVQHYKGKCYAWDVVNEALNEDGTMRKNVFLDTIGPSYIPIAFAAAAAADPDVKLYYNDYNIENPGAKSTGAANIVKDLQARKIKVDGVGMQAHFIAGSSPSYDSQLQNMKNFIALGVEVAYTELDVRITLPNSAEKTQQQATDYANAVKACVVTEKCVGITVWDFWDPASWVPSTFKGTGDATLFSAGFEAKPAVASIAQVLQGTT
ncbi:glycoside hydrolase family 10 protein [Aulographum hederae CBS 113979]|uniref:Beta-xylanase n=1 Tax=Aulographum hederae CBS 113979 TaxID=1176131 RepID=A0A6G1GSV1_9PEZI|nr:glycoside hydrolase family 10 protein [Aulographum hederae CBS 113979]